MKIENLEIIEVPQFKNGEVVHSKKGISFILNNFHFALDVNEADFLQFFPSDSNCKVQYRIVCFTLSNEDAIALQEKIQNLKE